MRTYTNDWRKKCHSQNKGILKSIEIKTDYVKNDFKGMVRDLQNAANDLMEKANNMIPWLGDDLSDLEKNTLDEYRFW